MGALCGSEMEEIQQKELSSTVSFEFAVIADQDKESKSNDDGTLKWKSYLQFGNITYDTKANKLISLEFSKPSVKDDFKGEFDKETNAVIINTTIGDEKQRGAEFSALCKHKEQNVLYTGDDRTGLLYQIDGDFKLKVIGKLIENKESGELMYIPGDELNDENIHDKGFKIEWMTYKESVGLCIGSVSMEQYTFDTRKVSPSHAWIAQVGSKETKTVKWLEHYNALRGAVGAVFPGWFYIECVIWSEVHKSWYILPRWMAINAPFDPLWANYGSSLMLIASEDFKDIKRVHLKLKIPDDNNVEYVESLYTKYELVNTDDFKVNLDHDFEGAKEIGIVTTESVEADELNKLQTEVAKSLHYCKNGVKGFSCARFMPQTNDRVIIAVRTLETDEEMSSSLCIFDIDGNVYVDEYPFKGNRKYEGIIVL